MELYVNFLIRKSMGRNVEYTRPVISVNFLAAMVALTKSMCWEVVGKTMSSTGIGLVVYQKPVSPSCYREREKNNIPMCDMGRNMSWYCF